MKQAHSPIRLEPPLRPFRPEDAALAAELNDAASGGIVIRVWGEKAGPDRDPWEVGRLRQIERMKAGQTMITVDTGDGAEAVMVGNPIGPDAGGVEGVPPVFHPLIELENQALRSWYINVIGTAPTARRRGHASRLMSAAEEIARVGEHEELSLIVSDANAPARALYARHGYTERAARPMVKEGPGADLPGENWLLLVKPTPEQPA